MPALHVQALRPSLPRCFLLAAIAVALSGNSMRAQVVTDTTPGPGRTTKSANRPTGVRSPVPPGIATAHKVFLSNGGAEAGLFPHPFSGTQDRGYGYLRDALLANSRFQIVDAPGDADLVIEIKLAAPSGSQGGDKKSGTEDALPLFTLLLYDRPTHYILWTLSQTIDKANLQKTHDKNFDEALDLLMKQLMTVAGAG